MSARPTPPDPTLRLLGEYRSGQLADERDHERCTLGNQRALLAEQLDYLKQGALKEMAQDNWMYKTSNDNSSKNNNVTTQEQW